MCRKPNLKLLVVSQYFWPETFGINRQVRDLVAQGVDVTVLTGKPNYPSGTVYPNYTAWGTKFEYLDGVKIFRVPLVPRGKASGVRLFFNYLSFVFFGLTCGPRILRQQQFDAIFVYAPSPILQVIPAILLSWLKRIPLAVWVQDLWPQSLSATGHLRNRLALWLLDRVVRWIYRSTDLLLVQSQAFVETVSKQTQPGRTIHYFPNSAEKFALSPSHTVNPLTAKWLELMRVRFAVVFTGNVGTAQSMATIVDAAVLCGSNPHICFFVVGAGSDSGWLDHAIKARGLNNLIATGWLSLEDMPAVLDAASVLLVSLLDKPIFHQTIPNKLQSYLASGKPVVASLAGEGANVVKMARAGLVCHPEDAPALADCILRLAAMSEEERIHFGRNGQKYFNEHFDPSVLTLRLIVMLNDLIAGNNEVKALSSN